MAPPFREVEFDITYGEGISREGTIIDMGVAVGIIDKAGAWLSYKSDRIGQGRENAKAFLKENLEILEKIEEEVLAKYGLARGNAVQSPAATSGAIESPKPVKAPKKGRGRK